MSGKTPEIRMIPIAEIRVLNPRSRNKRVFNEHVTSIAHFGLKKPITVSPRKCGVGYDLVCGQGRLEAFVGLNQAEIPAVVIDATEEDCFVMSLVENMARRQHSSLELVREIGALRQRGYAVEEIALKTDFSEEYVAALCHLLDHGEERLLAAMERGIVPASIAMEIVRVKDEDVQRAPTDVCERKALPGNQILAIRKIVEQRNKLGNGVHSINASSGNRKKVTADILIRSYRKETDRQKVMVEKATLAQSRLLFVVNALKRLLADEHFVTLLRAEAMHTLPRPLAERLEAGS
jgi:ParB family chromosome partitioning protein